MPISVFLSTYTADPSRGGNRFFYEIIERLRTSFTVQVVPLGDLQLPDRHGSQELVSALTSRCAQGNDLIIDGVFWKHFRALAQTQHFHHLIAFTQEDYALRKVDFFGRWRKERQLRAACPALDHHLVVSEFLAQRHRVRGCRQVECVLPGIATAALPANPLRTDERVAIIHAGVFHPAKGQDLVVSALAIACRRRPDLRPRLTLSLFGDPSGNPRYATRIRRQLAVLGREDALRGNVPQAELWTAFAQATCIVFPATGEGWPLTIAEAMAHGCIPVLCDDQWSREQVRPGYDGLLTARSTEALAEAIIKLADDAQLRARLSTGAWQTATARNRSWKMAAEQFLAEITAIVGPA